MKSYFNGPNNRVDPNKRVGSIKFAFGTQLIINSILSVKRFRRTVVKDTLAFGICNEIAKCSSA